MKMGIMKMSLDFVSLTTRIRPSLVKYLIRKHVRLEEVLLVQVTSKINRNKLRMEI